MDLILDLITVWALPQVGTTCVDPGQQACYAWRYTVRWLSIGGLTFPWNCEQTNKEYSTLALWTTSKEKEITQFSLVLRRKRPPFPKARFSHDSSSQWRLVHPQRATAPCVSLRVSDSNIDSTCRLYDCIALSIRWGWFYPRHCCGWIDPWSVTTDKKPRIHVTIHGLGMHVEAVSRGLSSACFDCDGHRKSIHSSRDLPDCRPEEAFFIACIMKSSMSYPPGSGS